jgi:hypothetical protein
MFLTLWIFSNFNTVFPVVVFVFGFGEFSEGVFHGHWNLEMLVFEEEILGEKRKKH